MLYGSQTIAHYSRTNVAIWMCLAFQAGTINIGGFMACHRFVSHVTGFATFFGYEISFLQWKHAFGMLAVPLFFLFGSVLSGILVDIRIQQHKRPRYFVIFGLIFFLLLVVWLGGILGFFGAFGESLERTRDYVLLALLCLVCGAQNGTVATVSRSVVRTTHLTGITTDLGLGIVRLFYKRRLPTPWDEEGKANLMRMGIIFSFGVGSVAGGFVFSRFGYHGFLLPVLSAGSLFLLLLYFQFVSKVIGFGGKKAR